MVRMADTYQLWLDQVRDALRSINMQMDDWQPVWSFDFRSEYDAGVKADDAATKASKQKALDEHRGVCQPLREVT